MLKNIISLSVSLILILLSVAIYLFYSEYYLIYDNKIRDQMFKIRGELNTTNGVSIIDIDEKSLLAFGQWPWSRDIMSRILANLTNAGAGIIGLDIFFAEKDGKSPSLIGKKFGIKGLEKYDYDLLLGDILTKTPTILGYFFDFENNNTKNILPNVPAVFIEKGLKEEFLLSPKGFIGNIEILQNNAYSGGYVNMIPDIDGVVRRVPLVMKYDDMIYPSLAFEMYRIATGVKKVLINYSEVGIESISLGKNRIKTDRFGRLFINYRGDKGKFPYISAADIYYNKFDKSLVEGRFVLIGTSAGGLFDLRVTPFNNVYPGVEVHANIIDNLIKGDYLYRPDFGEALDVLFIVSLGVITAFVFLFLNAINALVFLIILIGAYLYLNFYLMFHYGYIVNIVLPTSLSILLSIILSGINYFFESKKTKELKKAFAKKVSPDVMNELLKSGTEEILAPKEKEITIFFSDVRSFTTISEKLGDPKKLIELLNIYMTPMVEMITSHKGTIDKFIGDAIMAYWNAPNDVKNHADEAVSSAIDQLIKLKEINKILRKKFDLEINIGMGINSGVSTIGEMGSAGRADYTVIGDSVNLASRLEGLNKPYKTHIIISEFTKNLLKNSYAIRELDLVRVKGKKKAVAIFEVLGYEEDENFRKKRDYYYEALHLYRNSKFKEAKEKFLGLYKEYNDELFSIYVDRCEHFAKNPPKEFDGVFTFTTK